ncbi:uncharacterized protein At1g15400-like [Punica granatum]|nr:uncharacterized protein At1g15400-like [Punica granatum]OWM78254.1 hypothetical protein CDL15_Pgr015073 [Punica granatum]
MAGLQRSAVSFRRQGSSGLVWEDRFLSGELNQVNNDAGDEANKPKDPDGRQEPSCDPEKLSRTARSPPPPIEMAAMERNRSTGGGRYRIGRVSPAIEPPSPKVSACGFCGAFGKQSDHARKKAKRGIKHRSR